MSVATKPKRITCPQIRAMKGNTPVVCLTAYTSLTAVLLDDNVDLLLVGDSSAWCFTAWKARSASRST